MKKPRRKNSNADTLFDSPLSEQGIIGCALFEPSCLDRIDIPVDTFGDLRNRELFRVLRHLWQKYHAFDDLTINDYLVKKDLLKNVGGWEHIKACGKTESNLNLENYLGIVRDKFKRRTIHAACEKLSKLAENGDTQLDDLLFVAQSELAEVLGTKQNNGEHLTWNELLEFDTTNDVNNVLGKRWLCRGHSAWLIGPSGVGKSSLLFQFGISFAVGIPIFGIAPIRPLRVLIVQAENDKGDMSEMAKGIEVGLNLQFNELLQKNIRVRSVTGKIGQAFCAWLRTEILDYQAELVLVDPLLSFAGIDVSRQDQASTFCRVWLDPVLRETGAVLISAHHTGKPARENKNSVPQTLSELAYSGIGSSELVNWARAILFLQPAGDHHFRLQLAKRGQRAGATHPTGESTSVIWLRHAANGSIFWEQIAPEIEDEQVKTSGGQPSKVDKLLEIGLGSLIDSLAEPIGKNELARRIEDFAAEHKSDASTSTCKRAVERLVSNGALLKTPKGYKKP